jgi:GT2 family glycosyltransferase
MRSLERQTRKDFDVIIVDNSGRKLVRERSGGWLASVIENDRNEGFGRAVNQAFRKSNAPFLATLNDDAIADPGWVEALLKAVENKPDVGMCASQVRLTNEELDSAGLLICSDGSSKQRGHRQQPGRFGRAEEVLLPSGSAALYRRRMLDEIGAFDESFFLYCEDTDLGLRARWAGWQCLYVPEAVVEHRYSHSAGRASALKAYYVERNRLAVALKNFPSGSLWQVPFVEVVRYFWHVAFMFRGKGAASEFREGGSALMLIWLTIRAHVAVLARIGRLLQQRAAIRKTARITAREFTALMRMHSISPKQVASL